ncbi:MAG: hypothetical protein PSV23_16830 [Brevundimonas sp.]|uniref:hypothetical protein n=1 Tax=Brevundimonas sp. TaxID=1871086 RepID=UPI0024874DA8|nr:hypothetical protein [Brevundimonas sp.]MDI1328457.1 hypothetical protein [Brevundimonas sp.]
MLKLEATLVATMTAQPRQGGWSPDRGIDFTVWAPTRQSVAAAPANAERIVASEPVSFLDADDVLAPGMTVVRRYVSLAAQAAEAAAKGNPDLPLTRAWSSVARKAPGS